MQPISIPVFICNCYTEKLNTQFQCYVALIVNIIYQMLKLTIFKFTIELALIIDEYYNQPNQQILQNIPHTQ